MANKVCSSECALQNSCLSDTSIPCMKKKYTYKKIMKGKRYVYINLVKNIFPLSRINFFKKIIDYQMGISSSKYKGLLDEYN